MPTGQKYSKFFSICGLEMRKLKIVYTVFLLTFMILVSAGCDHLLEMEEPEFLSAQGVPALEYWQEHYPDYPIIKWAQGDMTDNGREDTIIIFKVDHKKNSMVAVLDYPDGYQMTEETPAPIENQTIEFLDFDDTPPTELVISGSKDGNVGYAIYRIIDSELINLFSQDMDVCC